MRKTPTISRKTLLKNGDKSSSLNKANSSQNPYLTCLGSKLSYQDLKEFDWKSNLPVISDKLPNQAHTLQDFAGESLQTDPMVENPPTQLNNESKLAGSFQGLKAIKHTKEAPFLHIITLSSRIDSTPVQTKDHFYPKKRLASSSLKVQNNFGSFSLPKGENQIKSNFPNRHASLQDDSQEINENTPTKFPPKSPIAEKKTNNPQSKPLNPNDFRRLTRKRPILRDLTSPEKPVKSTSKPMHFRFQSISTSIQATNELLNELLDELPKNKDHEDQNVVSKTYLAPYESSFNEKQRSNSSTSNIYELGDSSLFTIAEKKPSHTQQDEILQNKQNEALSVSCRVKSNLSMFSKLGRIVGSSHEKRQNTPPKIVFSGVRSKRLLKAPKLEL